ncbi:MAG: hypothetical protein IH604_11670 [Burkholderiales bacterium]|nr:hypothetical protein [Burkholderiales bacterium]
MIYAQKISSGTFSRLNDLHMSTSERQRVNAYIRDGERIADAALHALAALHSGAEAIAHGVKAVFAKPTSH